jgi:hypothetical protein
MDPGTVLARGVAGMWSEHRAQNKHVLYYGWREVSVYAWRNLRVADVGAKHVSALKARKKSIFRVIKISRPPSV